MSDEQCAVCAWGTQAAAGTGQGQPSRVGTAPCGKSCFSPAQGYAREKEKAVLGPGVFSLPSSRDESFYWSDLPSWLEPWPVEQRPSSLTLDRGFYRPLCPRVQILVVLCGPLPSLP